MLWESWLVVPPIELAFVCLDSGAAATAALSKQQEACSTLISGLAEEWGALLLGCCSCVALVVVAAFFVVCGGDGGGGNSWQRIFDGRDVKLLTQCSSVIGNRAISASLQSGDSFEETETETARVSKAFKTDQGQQPNQNFRGFAKLSSWLTFEEQCTLELLYSCGIATITSDTSRDFTFDFWPIPNHPSSLKLVQRPTCKATKTPQCGHPWPSSSNLACGALVTRDLFSFFGSQYLLTSYRVCALLCAMRWVASLMGAAGGHKLGAAARSQRNVQSDCGFQAPGMLCRRNFDS